jgi:hypothetical protein
VLIEKEILAYCYRKHKKMRKKLYENAWQRSSVVV